ncbi:hypothetical protein E5C26_01645 [Serratia proteamaculans]|uniref:hypothetical protein n=1 Tax=Serratia proteamaculans TaxID=28151 RepID=UPI001076650B|nr:hypothetical protein [Serratia proteamaculans]TFZ53059.1 hypothetical protein E5C26_01645 [Serratia proteamaculans]
MFLINEMVQPCISRKKSERKITQKKVERAIIDISNMFTNDAELYTPTTREIANRCNMSIYTARRILLDLANDGVVKSLKKDNEKCLSWYVNF